MSIGQADKCMYPSFTMSDKTSLSEVGAFSQREMHEILVPAARKTAVPESTLSIVDPTTI